MKDIHHYLSSVVCRWLALFCMAAIGVGLVAVWRYVLPERQVSQVYQHYEHADGIATSYIHNFRVNDTLRLDVTLLEATTDSAWSVLVRDFGLPELKPEIQRIIDKGEDIIFSRLVQRGNYSHAVKYDSPNLEAVGISYLRRTISVFHTQNHDDCVAVLHYNFKKSINQ